MSDEREVERLLKRAMDRRVKEILEGAAEEGQPRGKWLRIIRAGLTFPLTTLREWLRALRVGEGETDQRSQVWVLARAVSVLALPGLILYLILLPQLDLTQIVITTRVALSLLFGLGG